MVISSDIEKYPWTKKLTKLINQKSLSRGLPSNDRVGS